MGQITHKSRWLCRQVVCTHVPLYVTVIEHSEPENKLQGQIAPDPLALPW